MAAYLQQSEHNPTARLGGFPGTWSYGRESRYSTGTRQPNLEDALPTRQNSTVRHTCTPRGRTGGTRAQLNYNHAQPGGSTTRGGGDDARERSNIIHGRPHHVHEPFNNARRRTIISPGQTDGHARERTSAEEDSGRESDD
jgi:hypothetical protein